MVDSLFDTIEIRYQTALVVPPPYAHFFTIVLRPVLDKKVPIEITLTYTDRDDLELDEIVGEGFSGDDDYHWTGYLPAIWQQTIDNLVRKTRLKPFDEDKLSDNQDYFLVTIEAGAQGQQSGVPSQRAEWQFLSQELIQAAYEVSGKEKPFEVTYVEINSGVRSEVQLKASFSRREIRLETRQNNQNRSVNLPWKELKAMMEVFYGVEYNSEEAIPNIPRKTGQYLNLGTPEWYEISTAVAGEEEAIGKLRKLLARLVQA